MSAIVINNRTEVVDKLADILQQFDLEHTDYQEDVYLYLDEDGNGTLTVYENPGGNSWLNDKHYTIYRKPSCCSGKINPEEYWTTIKDFADVLGMTEESLIQEAAEYFEEDDLDYIGFSEVVQYLIETNYEHIEQCYKDYVILENRSGYLENADYILECFEDEMEEVKRIREYNERENER